MRTVFSGILALLAVLPLSSQDLRELTKTITQFTLPNGLHFLVVERREAPVISFVTFVRAGWVNDPGGQTGLAHMFEHLAYKGTETIGTKDWAAEKQALDAVEDAYDRLDAERDRKPKPDVGKAGAAEIMLNRAIEQARSLGQPAEFARTIAEHGGVGLAAAAGADSTEFSCSLPSNRLELWFLMESQRLLRPALRDFYREREAVAEEYREHMEANVQGRMSLALLSNALVAHPYGHPGQGWPSDLANLRRKQAKEFFDRYYVPGNITIAIAGDVDPAEAKRLAERYFGPMPARPLPPLVRTVEPLQSGSKTIMVESQQSIVMAGYRRPSHYDPDDLPLDLIQFILARGRTGWLHKEVVEKQVALAAQAASFFPGGQYPSLFVFRLFPAPGQTPETALKTLDGVLNRLATEPVDAATLARAKAQVKATVVQRVSTNPGFASMLATYHSFFGDWRKLLGDVDGMQALTAADVQRAARKYFTQSNRTVVVVTPPSQLPRSASSAAGGSRR